MSNDSIAVDAKHRARTRGLADNGSLRVFALGLTLAFVAGQSIATGTATAGAAAATASRATTKAATRAPGDVGTYAVGTVALDDPNGISGITDPTGATGPTYNVNLAWARIMYPATSAGTGTPVSGALARYPVAVFLHGRHLNCDNDGAGTGLTGTMSNSCPTANRVPSHEGYNYIMQRLASQGIVCISISAHQIDPDNGAWNYNARGRLVLKFLDKLAGWNSNGNDPFGGIFAGKLDMSRIGLSGHSRGGEGVVAAEVLNASWPTRYNILAVNAMAPTDQNSISYVPGTAAYFLLMGARDGDVADMQGYRTYDRAFPNGMAGRKPKSVVLAHGANHNYFNTIWTPTAQLGSTNPWAGASDDGGSLSVTQTMTGAEQREVTLQTVSAFFRLHLLGDTSMKDVMTGVSRPASMPNNYVYFAYQDGTRKAVDNFEQTPLNAATNTLGGSVTFPGFGTASEQLLNYGASDYTGTFTKDTKFFHDTLGMRLNWSTAQTYTTNLPAGQRNVSGFSHLTFRAAKRAASKRDAQTDLTLLVNIRDGAGRSATADLANTAYGRLPHPYRRSGGWCTACNDQALLNSVRIPLSAFLASNPQIDLTDIASVVVKTQDSGQVGIDDIEFGN